jgi:ABC-type glutathione transport system ATPase component
VEEAESRAVVQVLLLDELTTFLDFEDAQSVLDAVKEVVATGENVAAIWVTHRLEELTYADAVTCMEAGKVQAQGKPERILSHLRSMGATV